MCVYVLFYLFFSQPEKYNFRKDLFFFLHDYPQAIKIILVYFYDVLPPAYYKHVNLQIKNGFRNKDPTSKAVFNMGRWVPKSVLNMG